MFGYNKFHRKQFKQLPGIRKSVAHMLGTWGVYLTPHARQELKDEYFGSFLFPDKVEINYANIVEVEQDVLTGKIYAALARVPFTQTFDLTFKFALSIDGVELSIITCWLNPACDKDRNRYNPCIYSHVKEWRI